MRSRIIFGFVALFGCAAAGAGQGMAAGQGMPKAKAPKAEARKECKSKDEIIAATHQDKKIVKLSENTFPDGGRVIVASFNPFSGRAACYVSVYQLDEARGVWVRKSDELIDGTHLVSVEFGEGVIIRDFKGDIVRRYAVEQKPKAEKAEQKPKAVQPAPAGKAPATPVGQVKQKNADGTDRFVAIELDHRTLSPDGKVFAAFHQESWDEVITLHDAETGKEFRRMVGHGDAVTRFQFSPDGRMLASFAAKKGWRVWDVATGKEVMTLRVDAPAFPETDKSAKPGTDSKPGADAKSAPGT